MVKELQTIRRLTPVECERLQGFPDGWTTGVSDTQRYKCLGNAVTTNVITAIGERLIRNDRQNI
jgi:DNA (cytosine-5)-methyltransferase 1